MLVSTIRIVLKHKRSLVAQKKNRGIVSLTLCFPKIKQSVYDMGNHLLTVCQALFYSGIEPSIIPLPSPFKIACQVNYCSFPEPSIVH